MHRQNVLITGCGFALGRHTAEALAARGHWVFATMPDCFGLNIKSARYLENTGVMKAYKLDVLDMDVARDHSVSRAVDSVVNRAGRLDAVIHCAGIGALGLAEAFTVDQLRTVFEVNVFGLQRVNRAVLPHMRERRSGLLMHVSSVLGRFAMPNLAIYDASMFAVEALAEAYRYELSAVGVDSVLVEPGTFAAELEWNHVRAEDEERISQYGDNSDLGERVSSHHALSISPASPELKEVVDTMVALLEMKPGTRPLRTVVDRASSGPISELNDVARGVSERILESLGQGELLNLRR